MNAETIATALGGRKAGTGWMARCPAHDDCEPSLSMRDATDGKVLVHCHAGCSQESVIAVLHRRGLWTDHHQRSLSRRVRRAPVERSPDHDAKRSEIALSIWQSAKPAHGTPVVMYLSARGINLPPNDALRFHPGLKHRSGGFWPTMVALVTNGADGEPVAIRRTYLGRDGARKAPVDPAKMMLGPCRGGVVRLAEQGALLMVGEGIETCLSAMQATGHPAWAALSTSGLGSLDLPREVRDVIVLADGDAPGEAAARDCARRWKAEGRRVRIARPPIGMDFADLLVDALPASRGAWHDRPQ